jgi:hypothetical protein
MSAEPARMRLAVRAGPWGGEEGAQSHAHRAGCVTHGAVPTPDKRACRPDLVRAR